MKATTFDGKFVAGEKIIDELDLSKARRVNAQAKRVNVDFPAWMVRWTAQSSEHEPRLLVESQGSAGATGGQTQRGGAPGTDRSKAAMMAVSARSHAGGLVADSALV